jgi:cyclic-di-GMP phosphodiesterase TipF (flagellum assembly factor)
MARTTGGGRRFAVSAVAISTLAGIAAFLYLYLPEDLTAALWILTACSLALAGGVALQARVLAGQAAQLSRDLDVVSERLLRLEAESRPPAATAPDPRIDDLSADVQEATAELALLGEIVRDLAVAVATHDRELVALKAAGEKPVPVQREAPRPAPQVAAPAPAPAPFAARERPAPPVAPLPEWTAPPDDRPGDAAVISAFEGDRLELHLQPVVSLPQRKVQFYEALARLRLDEGTLLVPAEFLPVLERRGLMPDLDRKVLARSAAIARHLAARGSEALIACNLASASLAEPGFLRAVSRLVEAHPDLTGRLVLELSQRCWRTLDAERAGALAQLRDRGLVFALDRATDLRLDPLSLADRGVRFVKLPAEMLLAAEAPHGLDVELHDLAAVLSRAGIKLIAERVERAEDVPDLLDLDVPLAQGFVFSPPRPVRAEVLSSPVAAAAPAQAAPAHAAPVQDGAAERPPEPAPEPQKRPFRSFLRRAS